MLNRRRAISVLITLAVFAGTTFAGLAFAASPASSGPVTFTVGVLDDMTTMSPFKAYGQEFETFWLVYDQLYNFSQKDLSPVSDLAQWPPAVTPDHMKYTFNIVSGVKWSDGKPLTAADIAFTYNYILKNNMGNFVNYLGPTKSITAPDATTLVWTFKQPSLAPEAPPWIPIVPQHVWQGMNKQQALDYRNVPTVGSGPFRLVSWKEGQGWTLTANKDYFLGAPHVDQVVFQVFNDPQAMAIALKNGSIDFADALPAELFDSLQGTPNITTHAASALSYRNLVFNTNPNGTGNPALLDPEVRLAIAHAINKSFLVSRVLSGQGIPGSSIVLPSNVRYFWQPPPNEVIGYDPQLAAQELDQAGYKLGSNGLRIDPKTGKPLTLSLYVLANQPGSADTGPLIAAELSKVGITVDVKAMTSGQLLTYWGNDSFDMYIWGQYPTPDPDYILSIFTTSQCHNLADTCWSNAQYDKLYQQQQVATSYDQRKQIVDQMQQIIYQQNPELVLFYERDLQAYRNDRFTGFLPQPDPGGSYIESYGPYSYINIRPVAGSTGQATRSGVSGGVWIGLAVAVIVLAAAALLLRRRANDEDRA